MKLIHQRIAVRGGAAAETVAAPRTARRVYGGELRLQGAVIALITILAAATAATWAGDTHPQPASPTE